MMNVLMPLTLTIQHHVLRNKEHYKWRQSPWSVAMVLQIMMYGMSLLQVLMLRLWSLRVQRKWMP